MVEGLRDVALYSVGWTLVLLGVVAGIESIVGGAFLVLAGGLAHPFLRRWLADRYEVEVPQWAAVGAVAVPVLIGLTVLFASVGGLSFLQAAPDVDGPANDSVTATTSVPTVEHEIGERFSVGDGGNAVSITVTSASLYDHVSTPFTSAIPDGQFLVVTLRVANDGDSAVELMPAAFRVVDATGASHPLDGEAASLTADDDRIGVRGIEGERLQPGLSATRVAVFDVPQRGSYSLVIATGHFYGNAARHRVPLEE